MNSICTAILLLQPVLAQEGPHPLNPAFVEMFEAHELAVAQPTGEPRGFRYRLFVPEVQAGTRYPLIVWLHGAGESGSDNITQLSWIDSLIYVPPRERSRFQFFLLAAQCPQAGGGWRGEVGVDDAGQKILMVDVVAQMIEATLKDRPIDPARVVAAGLSSGGSGAWELGLRHGELLAAIAPLASAGARAADLEPLKRIPVWAFHNDGDSSISPRGDMRSINDLTALGGRAHLTLTHGSGHNCWTEAFERYHLLDWLLEQRRGRRSVFNAPGHVSIAGRAANVARGWTWWQLLLQAAVLSSPIVAVFAWRRLRQDLT